jgi:CRISPR-associated endoribonuclease Cas6
MKIKFFMIHNGIIPSDYQNKLCAAFYKSISNVPGYENYHDEPSVHNISQLYGTKQLKNGDFITNPDGNGVLTWTISSPIDDLVLNAASNLVKSNTIIRGLKIVDFEIEDPLTITGDKMSFVVQSPVILKQTIDKEKHYYVVEDEDEQEEKLTTIKGKTKNWYIHRDNRKCCEIMSGVVRSVAKNERVGFILDPNLKITFDQSYKNRKVLKVKIKKDKLSGNFISCMASKCPVIVEGNPESINFVYNLGIGHSTGMGFGTL